MNKKKSYLVTLTLILCFNLIFLTVKLHVNEQDDRDKKNVRPLLTTSSSVVYEWNQTWGGSDLEEGYGVAVDSLGNIYIVGYTESFGAGSSDMVLVKYNDNGVQQWNRTWGGDSYDRGYGVAVDSLDNVYVVGYTYSDMVLVKYNGNGVQQWNHTWGGVSGDGGYGVFVDSLDNVYLAGATISFGAGSSDMVLVKYNGNGVQQWNRTWGGNNYDLGWEVVLDSSNNIYLAGYTESFGAGSSDMVLVKYNGNGVQQWNRTWGGSNIDECFGVAVDSSGNIFLAGYTFSFGAGLYDMVLVKYDGNGVQQWNRTWGGNNYDLGYGVAVDSSDNIYLAGYTDFFGTGAWDMVLVKYDGNGFQQWTCSWVGSSFDWGRAVVIDSVGNIYLAGYTTSFGAGGTDMVLVKYVLDIYKPVINIINPHQNERFGVSAPDFNISIIEPNLNTTWYSLDAGVTNITFSGLTGIISQTEWDKIPDGPVNINFYANDTEGNIGYAELTIFKDSIIPQIIINLPIALTLFGSIAPSFNISITESYLDSTWYTIDEGITNVTFISLTGIIDQEEWNKKISGSVTLSFYANDSAGNIAHNSVSILKDIDNPEITINNPIPNQVFEDTSPTYDISIVEANLDTMWYTLDGGVTNYTITQFNGTINQNAWTNAPYGYITIRFCAKDLAGNIGYSEVIIEKSGGLPITLIIILSSISGIIIIGVIIAIYLKKRHK